MSDKLIEELTPSANAWNALWKNHKECWASHPLYIETSKQLDRDGCQSAWVHLASFVDALIKAVEEHEAIAALSAKPEPCIECQATGRLVAYPDDFVCGYCHGTGRKDAKPEPEKVFCSGSMTGYISHYRGEHPDCEVCKPEPAKPAVERVEEWIADYTQPFEDCNEYMRTAVELDDLRKLFAEHEAQLAEMCRQRDEMHALASEAGARETRRSKAIAEQAERAYMAEKRCEHLTAELAAKEAQYSQLQREFGAALVEAAQKAEAKGRREALARMIDCDAQLLLAMLGESCGAQRPVIGIGAEEMKCRQIARLRFIELIESARAAQEK